MEATERRGERIYVTVISEYELLTPIYHKPLREEERNISVSNALTGIPNLNSSPIILDDSSTESCSKGRIVDLLKKALIFLSSSLSGL